MTILALSSPADVLDAVRSAVSAEAPLEILGHGSKRGIGRPVEAAATLDLRALSGVTLYEPEELVLSARAGTPLADIQALLAENRQELAFEPMDTAPLLGGTEGQATVGGTLAANLSGPRRLKAGAARDHVLGINAVSGRGEMFKSGGRVVKNVTGYDLSKAMAGSWGTLAVLTDVTLKVLPRAETEATLVLRGASEEEAAQAMAMAMGSSAEASGAAHLPQSVTGKVIGGALSGSSSTLVRLEGFGPSVDYRQALLERLLARFGDLQMLEEERSRRAWTEIRDAVPFAGRSGVVWRVSMAPSQGHRMVMALRMEMAADAFYDWQGGLVWLHLPEDPAPEALRRLVRLHGGGHATLIVADEATRARVPVFEPQPAALAALSLRLKESFDPLHILNRGRMLRHEATEPTRNFEELPG